MKRRVVITGVGLVSCFGTDVDAFYEALLAGKSGVRRLNRFVCDDYPTRIAAAVYDSFNPEDFLDKKVARRVDPFIAYACAAASGALKMAGLYSPQERSTLDPLRTGVLVGSGMGGMALFSETAVTLHEKGYRRVSPFFVPYIISNMAGAQIAIEFGFMGPNYSIATACATSNNCILAALEHIRRGDTDIMLCGGTEAALNPCGLAGFIACKAVSSNNDAPEKASRPFDMGRDGFVMGEGAGVLVLESYESAKARGATILAELLGGATTCDAYHMTTPREDAAGILACMRQAIRDAGLTSQDISYINAHATATPIGDKAELCGLYELFGSNKGLVTNATKSMIGHGLGAAGAFEAIATICALRSGIAHPTVNFTDAEQHALALGVSAKAQKINAGVALSNSFGFGGHNASIVLASL